LSNQGLTGWGEIKMKLKTIQTNLFFTYSLIIVLVVTIFVSFIYIWVSDLLKTRAFDSIDNLSTSFIEKLDSEIRQMDSVALDICYSNLVKNRFEKYTSYSSIDYNNNESKLAAINNSKELIDILTAINGPSRAVQQINLYDFNNQVFGTGFDNTQRNVSLDEKDWYKEVMKKDGGKVITLPHKDPELSKIISKNDNINYISICRLYFGTYNVVQGVVEVKQYSDTILKNIIAYMKKDPVQERIFVYDSSGKVIYPYSDNTKENSTYYYNYYEDNSKTHSFQTVLNPLTKEKELLMYKTSDYTGWTVAVVTSEKTLLSPITNFTKVVLFVSVIILFLALLFSFFAAQKYTTPIKKLRKIVRSINLQEPSFEIPAGLNSGLNELEELNQAFYKMNKKLKTSIDELLLSQQHEMQSKMLALQSQMNPHFLYNTLANISAMAEEEMNEQIIEMCAYISDMLRYISSDSSPLVEINTEIEYTEKYLACMKFRYGSKLSYSIDIDEDVKNVKIPKLSIQPLVENALKFGTKKLPPWDIKISGYIKNNYWHIHVQDNGPGFDAERLEQIHQKMQEIDDTGLLPSLDLEGMGLLNIYIRLKLIYKENMIFIINKNLNGGTIILIGGSIKK
jgi:two-component system sensor histidine kinase YesM